jgi:hypothetical protein
MSHTHRHAVRPPQQPYQPRSNAFTGGGMIAGSVAAGLLFTVWSEAKKYHQEPLKKYAMLAGGGAAISIGQDFMRSLVSGQSR